MAPSAVSLVSYDQIPYHSGPFRQTHPCHLATLPVLFGQPAPPVRSCRVLELGCASGGNLLPMAIEFPESEFVGVDLSARQIADGQQILDELKLSNLALRHQSILDIGDADGQFDYIICHGVYSWVPRAVQDKILEIGARNLKPGGLCYVSYNTYPGWHLRGTVRDMMRYHVAGFDDPQTQIQQARSLLEFLNTSTTPRSEAYRLLLSEEAKILNRHSDNYLFHEHLEEVNAPLYFHEFIERATAAGLQYLADTDFGSMVADRLDEQTAAILRDVSLLQQEQYMDFLRNRMFRASVLCHAGIRLDRNVKVSRLAACHVALDDRLELVDPPLGNTEPLEVAMHGEQIATTAPLTKAALVALNSRWPDSVAFSELLEDAVARASAAGAPMRSADRPALEDALCTDLMTLFMHGLVRLQVDPPQLVQHAAVCPETSALVRLQARQGALVTNRRHQMIQVADLPRALLQQLDGRRDRPALKQWLAEAIARQEFHVRRDEQRLDTVDDRTLDEILNGTLELLVHSALLVH